jgi:hypothetical protein
VNHGWAVLGPPGTCGYARSTRASPLRIRSASDSRSLDWPVIARSAIISPTTLLNLNQCLENPAEIETCGKSGCTSRMIAKRPAMISLTNWELRVRLFVPIPKSSRYPHKYTI